MISVRRVLFIAGAGAVLGSAAVFAALAGGQSRAVPCTGLHPMIIMLCADGSSVGYTCDPETGRWVMGTCPLPLTISTGQN